MLRREVSRRNSSTRTAMIQNRRRPLRRRGSVEGAVTDAEPIGGAGSGPGRPRLGRRLVVAYQQAAASDVGGGMALSRRVLVSGRRRPRQRVVITVGTGAALIIHDPAQ